MDEATFRAEAARDGYDETVVKEAAAGTVLGTHTHERDLTLLVLDGEMAVVIDGLERLYQRGDTLTLAAGIEHSERVGPDGVRYLVARR